MEKLADDFDPGAFDVICARGKEAYTHQGNRSFRATLEYHLESYAVAESKQEKSQIVSMVFNGISEASPDGGFVRKNLNGEWCRVPDHVAREKIGQGFRDLLYTDYRSSTKQKIQRRREKLYSTGAEAEDNESGGARKDQKEARRMTDVEPLPLDDQSAEDPVNAEILRQCSFSFVTDETSQQSSAEYTPSLSRESHSYSGDSSSGYYSYYSYNENFSNHSYGASPYSYYPVPVPRAPSNITREGGPVHYPYYYPPRPYDANREGGHPYGRVHSWQTGSFDSYYSHESSGQATSAAPPPPPHPFWYG